MLDKVGGEDGADGVQAAQEGGSDAVEAHGGDGGLGALPLLKSSQEEEGGTHAGQGAGDGHGQNEVLLLPHPAVAGGVLVGTGGLQLVAQTGLFQEDPHGDADEDAQGDGDVLVVAKQLPQPQAGQESVWIGGRQGEGVGAGLLLHLAQEGVDQIEADPVEHDAGDDLVDVAVSLQQAGDSAQDGTGQDGGDEAHVPGQSPGQGAVQAGASAHHILTGGTDVEQADLEGEQDG